MRPSLASQAAAAARAGLALSVQLLWPIHCLGCGVAAPTLLCGLCRASCLPHRGSRCRRCDDSSPMPLCVRCRKRGATGLEASRGVWRYHGPIQSAVLAGKHHGHEGVWAVLAETMQHDEEARQLGCASSALVPVPLSTRRRFGRGYNPSALLAAALGHVWHRPVRHLLRACAPFYAQPHSRLGARDRERDLPHAFAVAHPHTRLTGQTLLLVDDVITTCATLAAAAQALHAQGAHRVLAVALARQTREHGI